MAKTRNACVYEGPKWPRLETRVCMRAPKAKTIKCVSESFVVLSCCMLTVFLQSELTHITQ